MSADEPGGAPAVVASGEPSPVGEPPRSIDVLVIGAGPAGALAARALARDGIDVLLVDRDAFPRWKVCGCCVGGGGAAALAAEGLGALLDDLGATRPDTLAIESPGRSVRLALGATRVVSRTALDAALVEAARTEGARVHTGWSAALGPIEGDRRHVELRRGERRVAVRATLVLAATGLTPLSALPGARVPRTRVAPASRIGVGAVFAQNALGRAAPTPSTVRMRVGRGGYVGLSRLEDGSIDVAGAIDPAAIRDAGGISEAVSKILIEAGTHSPQTRTLAPVGEPITGWRGTPALTRSAVRSGAERVLLVGDAAGYVEPFTGEGMTWALEAARAVVPHARRIVDSGWQRTDLTAWHRECRRARRARAIVGVVAWISRTPGRVDLAMRLLERAPRLAAPFVHAAGGAPRVIPLLRSRSA